MSVLRPQRTTRPSTLLCLALTFLLASATGCNEPAPARVQLELPDIVLSADPVKVLVWKFGERNEKSVGKGAYPFLVDPPALASVDEHGQLTCQSSGDGTVTVDVSGVAGKAKLRCRLVDRIDTANIKEIDLGKGAVELNATPYDKQGNALSDVPLSITTRNTKVARPSGSKLEPLSVGRAKLTLKTGSVSQDVEVDIVRAIQPEALPMNDNQRIHFSLEPGRYELVVELESEKELEAEWRSAPYCNYKRSAKVHRSDCVLRDKGGVVFDNPAFLNSGSKEVSHAGVQIRQIPER